MRLLVVAPPGAGKGTQAEKLAAHYGIVHISSGDLLRKEVTEGTKIGRTAAGYLRRGDLVPDELVIEMLIAPVLEAARQGGYVLDGFPRTLRQAEEAYRVAKQIEAIELQAVIHLEVSHEELRRRLLSRARRDGRSDDTDAVIDHRLEVFDSETEPLLAFYAERGLAVDVNGEQPVDQVFADIVSAVDRLDVGQHPHRRSPTGDDEARAWPDLTLSGWQDTLATFHMWTQIVGKIRMALEPMLNHWWQVPLYVSARGLTTSLMHAGTTGLEIEFDLVDHRLDMRTSDGRSRQVALEPRSVANFYEATMAALGELGVSVTILPRPVEVTESIAFAQDEKHHAYDAVAVQRFWLALLRAHRVMARFRTGFVGKTSPVHFFWGGPDLAVTRFSGRKAPKHPGGVPNCANWVMELAYSHEVSSCGYWPGGSAEGSFYSYAYPQPEGFAAWPVTTDAAYYDDELGEFLLPYAAVRTAEDPDAFLLSFLQSTYEAAAELAGWDRAALEIAP